MRSLRQSHVFAVTWRFFLNNVYRNNRDASFELQQNAQMCISYVTGENLSQVAMTRVEEIEALLLSVVDISSTYYNSAFVFLY